MVLQEMEIVATKTQNQSSNVMTTNSAANTKTDASASHLRTIKVKLLIARAILTHANSSVFVAHQASQVIKYK
jgi:phosphoribosylpyrophosphate synthetase